MKLIGNYSEDVKNLIEGGAQTGDTSGFDTYFTW